MSAGGSIFIREVEDVLAAHPGVLMAAVLGAPDDKWGEAVTAFVVAQGDAPPAEQELIDLVRKRKGSAHAPKRIEFVPQLPLTGVGKIDKKKLRAALWAGHERMVGLKRRPEPGKANSVRCAHIPVIRWRLGEPARSTYLQTLALVQKSAPR